MSNNILVIDADIELTDLLSELLTNENFSVSVVHHGEEGVKKCLNQSFDAIILDGVLPKMNGFEVLKTIRTHSQVPILMLTGREGIVDHLVGLELGADDYLPKPCNPRELIARLKTILRRSQNAPAIKPLIECAPIAMDCSKRAVTRDGKPLELTNAEFNILEMLIKSPGQAFSKEELTEYALGRKFTAFDRSIDVHISNLRTKLGNNSEGEPLLKTVRGFGYMFSPNSEL